ncbi:hypothetical protein PFICI_06848 [Pestalotiopsis fici W106-1]|uniref:Uncharacterized protein n=1 Tax=Pestalotiopsis fici (strain W106-1 / CGMCC3.15140) TaxID=1229662 RepID=W3X9K3_PESFW|nr:uncharacterized protein PFICI_06848 [Pestalotiopsis fici W106-1]ETS81846.1 hypothetical protein PFICI_06848 [Pestalotiopsis fici W106-1]
MPRQRGPYTLVDLKVTKQESATSQSTQSKHKRQCLEAPEGEERRGECPYKCLLREQELVQSQLPNALVRRPASEKLWIAKVGGVLFRDVENVEFRVEFRKRLQIYPVVGFAKLKQRLRQGARFTTGVEQRRRFKIHGLRYELLMAPKDARESNWILEGKAPYLSLQL